MIWTVFSLWPMGLLLNLKDSVWRKHKTLSNILTTLKHFLLNDRTNFNETLHKASLMGFKFVKWMATTFSKRNDNEKMIILSQNLKNPLHSLDPLGQFLLKFVQSILGWRRLKFLQIRVIQFSKNEVMYFYNIYDIIVYAQICYWLILCLRWAMWTSCCRRHSHFSKTFMSN